MPIGKMKVIKEYFPFPLQLIKSKRKRQKANLSRLFENNRFAVSFFLFINCGKGKDPA